MTNPVSDRYDALLRSLTGLGNSFGALDAGLEEAAKAFASAHMQNVMRLPGETDQQLRDRAKRRLGAMPEGFGLGQRVRITQGLYAGQHARIIGDVVTTPSGRPAARLEYEDGGTGYMELQYITHAEERPDPEALRAALTDLESVL